jgi:folate-binding protein YgfZ
MLSTALSPAYDAARHGAALCVRDRGLIVVSGRDRASYLQGLLTNDIAALQAGQGCYTAYLTAQGRMIADAFVYELGDVILLAVSRSMKDTVLAKLDQFIFAEDVQLGDVTERWAEVLVVGPNAGRVVSAATGADTGTLEALPEHGNLRCPVRGETVIVLRVADTGAPGFALIGSRDQRPALVEALHAAGASDLDGDTAQLLRVEAGVPLFGADMDEDTIPLEAGIESRAISFTKGCYVGQEVIIRVLHRGHGRVARRLVGLRLDGASAPSPGTRLLADGKEVGVITSSAVSPAASSPIALGYVKRDFVEPGTRLNTPDGDVASVTTLPFVAA